MKTKKKLRNGLMLHPQSLVCGLRHLLYAKINSFTAIVTNVKTSSNVFIRIQGIDNTLCVFNSVSTSFIVSYNIQ